MELNWVEHIGLAAGALTTAAYLPQVYRTWRTKAVADISLVMYGFMFLGVLLWLVYGVLIKAPAVIAANGVCLTLVGGMLRMKIKYGRRAKADEARQQPSKADQALAARQRMETLAADALGRLRRGASTLQEQHRKTWGKD